MVLDYFLHLVYLCDICDEIAKTFLQLVLSLYDTCCLSQSISTISCSLSNMCDAFDVFGADEEELKAPEVALVREELVIAHQNRLALIP